MQEMGLKRADVEGARRSRILVVDADKEIRQVLSQILEEEDHEVIFGQSPESLDQMLAAPFRFDVVLIELTQRPEPMLDMLLVLKELCPRTEVIFISQPSDIHFWLEAIRRGAYEYLPKPVDREDLLWTIGSALGKHRNSQPLKAQDQERSVGFHARQSLR
jgi:DNA-binding NtrC family response regulator